MSSSLLPSPMEHVPSRLWRLRPSSRVSAPFVLRWFVRTCAAEGLQLVPRECGTLGLPAGVIVRAGEQFRRHYPDKMFQRRQTGTHDEKISFHAAFYTVSFVVPH